ncbi:hypothetical protein B0F90DRAFT_1949095, partial [Multifurca ochricompacta]
TSLHSQYLASQARFPFLRDRVYINAHLPLIYCTLLPSYFYVATHLFPVRVLNFFSLTFDQLTSCLL